MPVEGYYNYHIVALSIAIAILASYSAFNMMSKLSLAKGKVQWFWLFSGALVMGSGIWSMHFIGMLGFHLHVQVNYDTTLTLLSMAASVAAAFVAFYTTIPKNRSLNKIALGGFFMGSDIIVMHYTGMAAMRMPLELEYDLFYWILSALIALVVSYVALLLLLRFRDYPASCAHKWLSAIVMGIAVCGMHYTGMKAAVFRGDSRYLDPVIDNGLLSVDPLLLGGVTLSVCVILLVSWVTVLLDRHVLEKMAYTDSITGLPNRNEMNRFFDTYMGEDSLGVLFLDLDQFKVINDTLGHPIGDRLIQEMGIRLRSFISARQQVFRIGGDEFLVIVRNCHQEQCELLADQILHSIKMPYYLEANELYITASIGIGIGPIEHKDRSILLKKADTAMYKAKGLGKNQYFVYNEEIGHAAVRRMELEKDLRRAFDHQEFFVVYQPKWNVATNQPYGFEALVRWNHPRLGVVSPIEFIPIAEETGLIIPMTRWVLEEACRQCVILQQKGIRQPLSVNVSIRLFKSDSLLEMIQSVLSKTGATPHLLELEITESMILYDVNDIVRQLKLVRDLGVRVSMDDFGTGYSSIGLLDQIPIDALKLDRLFTNDLHTPSKRAIINAIILMAESLQLDVIAEGVESKEHLELLKELGCKVIQGYYYSKPMAREEIEAWLQMKNCSISGQAKSLQ
ncbi:bifunctional diguanylate cyclase/phosphodiesterase [Paenibacillus sp. UNC451MF]|uniref:bifunctional diguanylate cyclase/phosphodiesterase n=1 Tax=Paenibacillus sp. UNC451MF TaxID=1449063 RepID=UPI00048CFAED|nr:bifunctional diguanylate cyclase/phosphodiesterase [Paenibacillus sp. UNC451MF]